MRRIADFLSTKKPKVAVLIDPENYGEMATFNLWLDQVLPCDPDLFLLGGSSATMEQTEACLLALKQKTSIPVVLFPGGAVQFSAHADALLFMSLISGRNPRFLIEEQIHAARSVHLSGIETIPTSYLLLDGGTVTSTQKISQTEPMNQARLEAIEDTVLAGKLLGHTCTYLDAGSGAMVPVLPQVIQTAAAHSTLLFVGGGLRSVSAIRQAHEAGAKVVVIGNHLESNLGFTSELAEYASELRRIYG